MGLGFAEMPLALFSTLAPMGAGAFLVLALAFSVGSFKPEELKRIDKMTLIPFLFAVVGFIAAFFHLASPVHALGVFANTGASPLSNELVAGCIFMVAAIVYVILALTGKLAGAVRTGCAWAVAVLGLIFAVFTGMAYLMDTIQSWNTPLVPLEMLAFAVAGGACVGAMTLAFAGVSFPEEKTLGMAVMVLTLAGVVLGAVFACMQTFAVSGMENYVMDGAAVVGGVVMWLVCAVVCLLAAGAFNIMALKGKSASTFATVAVVLAFAGILLARLVFYATEFSVGLAI